MHRTLSTLSLPLSITLLVASCAAPPPAADGAPFASTDKVVVRYAPSSNFAPDRVQTFEIRDAATIAMWRQALATVAREWDGEVILVNFAGDPPEHHVEFWMGDELLGKRRLKSGMLDTESRDGWSFYPNAADRAFRELVAAVQPIER